MIGRLAFVAAAFALIAAPAAAQPSDNLAGAWRGSYEQSETRTAFEVTFEQDGPRLTGVITETPQWAGAQPTTLRAIVSGRVKNGYVEWLKTYDGTAGQSHAVRYFGRIIDANTVAGVWRIDFMTDSFEMRRIERLPRVNGADSR